MLNQVVVPLIIKRRSGGSHISCWFLRSSFRRRASPSLYLVGRKDREGSESRGVIPLQAVSTVGHFFPYLLGGFFRRRSAPSRLARENI